MYDYTELKAGLEKIVSNSNCLFTESEVVEIAEYLKVAEFGLAFETACDIIIEEKKEIDSELFESLKKIGQQMEYDEEYWLGLEPFIKNE